MSSCKGGEERLKVCESGVKVGMVVGGAVDYWAGRVSRAPGLVR